MLTSAGPAFVFLATRTGLAGEVVFADLFALV